MTLRAVSDVSAVSNLVLRPAGIPVQQWVECERCKDASRDESSVHAWANHHMQLHPGHERFRIVNQTYWRLEPSRLPPP
jgi:hypothetical protein